MSNWTPSWEPYSESVNSRKTQLQRKAGEQGTVLDACLFLSVFRVLRRLAQMISHFSSNAFAHTGDTRKNEIASYIEANYAEELTLEDIAGEFALTPQYFSKYFKSAFGTSFLKYFNGVQLLVHCGVNTVETNGDGFRILNKNRAIRSGPAIPSLKLIITDAADHRIEFRAPQSVKRGDSVIL